MRLSEPDTPAIEAFLAREKGLAFSYEGVTWTRECRAPAGFDHDRNRVKVGEGREAFESACAAVRRWEMFPKPWTRIYRANAPIAEGTVVAVIIKTYGFWWLNSARIVYTINEPRRFGFAYGTLPGHCEMGEERFLIEWLEDDSVWYDLQAFSRPRILLARIGYPLARHAQRRFVRESQASMVKASNPINTR